MGGGYPPNAPPLDSPQNSYGKQFKDWNNQELDFSNLFKTFLAIIVKKWNWYNKIIFMKWDRRKKQFALFDCC